MDITNLNKLLTGGIFLCYNLNCKTKEFQRRCNFLKLYTEYWILQ